MCQAAGCLLLKTQHFSFPAASLIPLLRPLGDPKNPLQCQPTKMRDTATPWCPGKSRGAFLSQLGRHALECPVEEKSGAGDTPVFLHIHLHQQDAPTQSPAPWIWLSAGSAGTQVWRTEAGADRMKHS